MLASLTPPTDTGTAELVVVPTPNWPVLLSPIPQRAPLVWINIV